MLDVVIKKGKRYGRAALKNQRPSSGMGVRMAVKIR